MHGLLARGKVCLYNSGRVNKHLLLSFTIFILILIVTAVVIFYGKGYRFGLATGKVEFKGTGLLVTKSTPDGAQVFINGHLTTATNNTINLTPKSYDVRIEKQGYFPWQKTVIIEEEVVSQADAFLFPTAPKLESITEAGVLKAVMDPSQTRIAYTVASSSAQVNGVYVYDTTSRPILTLQSSSTQITNDVLDLFSQADIAWSPNGREIIATISADLNPRTYLLRADGVNSTPSNVTEILPSVQARFEQEKTRLDSAKIASLPRALRPIASRNFQILAYSPDDTKILYTATSSATLPIVIKPRIIGSNPTTEERSLEEGEIYVYDIKEDRNYKLNKDNFEGAYAWFPDSKHLIYVNNKKVLASEYDGLNETTVYAGPFIDAYLFPWSDGSRIVILTDLGNDAILPNLYTISLR